MAVLHRISGLSSVLSLLILFILITTTCAGGGKKETSATKEEPKSEPEPKSETKSEPDDDESDKKHETKSESDTPEQKSERKEKSETGTSERKSRKRHSPEKPDWESYKAHHKKKYKDAKHAESRQKHFLKKMKDVDEHNLRFEKKLETYERELNKFADEDPEELKRTKTGFIPLNETELAKLEPATQGRALTTFLAITVPPSFDWRTSGAVGPVRNQGDCGCCYAFAALAAVQSQIFIKTKQMPNLSEQALINCDTSNRACNGGNYLKSFKHMTNPGSIQVDATGEFVSGTTKVPGACPNGTNVNHVVKSYKLLGKNETLIQQYLVKIGPLAVSIYSVNLFTYSNGIFDCAPTTIVDHSVLLVGYGTSETGIPYWIIRNNWGEDWGLDGYFHLKRGSNACGIQIQAAFPVL